MGYQSQFNTIHSFTITCFYAIQIFNYKGAHIIREAISYPEHSVSLLKPLISRVM
eukprot:c49133_g1_i1 orf=1-162(-)